MSPLVPPVGGAAAGLGVAALFALVPAATLEDWVWASGLPALIAAAAPPLGTTARAVLALSGGAMVASVVWSMLYLLVGPGGLLAPKTPANAVPVVRRPDVRKVRPMTAADLGTPLMEVSTPPVERDVPRDLDQPLAAFDPGAILPVPLPPPSPVPPIARRPIICPAPPAALAPGERIDTYVLTPPVADPAVSIVREPVRRAPALAEKPSIDALLRRLEEVTAQRMALQR